MNKKISIIIIFFVIALLFGLFLSMIFHPFLQPLKILQKNVSKKVPLGTEETIFYEIAKQNDWAIVETRNCGLIQHSADSITFAYIEEWQEDAIGIKSVRLYIDRFFPSKYSSVDLYVAFDEKNTVCFIHVEKTYGWP